MHQPGDIVFLWMSKLDNAIECEVLEVNAEDGGIVKMKAVYPDPLLGKAGFLLEGEDWISKKWDIFRN